MRAEIYAAIVIGIILLFFIQSNRYRKQSEKSLRQRLGKAWGNASDREITYEELSNISKYYEMTQEGNFSVDDITWNDLDMDRVYALMNNCNSSIGDEYLYKMLRTPLFDRKKLEKRDALITFFENHKEEALKISFIFARLGRAKKVSFYEYLTNLKRLGKRSNTFHYILDFILIAAACMIFLNSFFGILLLVASISFNIIYYYRKKAEVENYFICIRYIVNLIQTADDIAQLPVDGIKEYQNRLSENTKKLKKLCSGSRILGGDSVNTGDLADVLLDYVRMITHIDLMKFNSMLGLVIENMDVIQEMFETAGEIETAISIASFRTMLPYYCKPEYEEGRSFGAKEIYHPLISNAIPNDLEENMPVLLTGSNASGKSTFLKTIAINAILGQTINTVTAKSYHSDFYRVYSSMALHDNLEENESYYIVEIKSLKRIMDAKQVGSEKGQVLCFVDEVLRGTNTVERIAASSRILKTMAENNIKVFAATHDVELTYILEDYYSNYHFQEEVKENDVIFDYHLNKGRATSRNAIKLLGVMGYDKNLIKNAEDAANDFLQTGTWKKI